MSAISARKLFVPTLKAVNNVSVTSHQLLIRAGFMRQSGQGLFNILPLGLRTLNKLEKIIDEEMASIGGQKLSLTSLISAELWKKTGRWDEMGEEMMRLQDRKKADYALAPTAEEEITSLVASEMVSAKHLPLRLYQIGRKYRDEIRPRFGLMRSREFIMKDMYTFDVGAEYASRTYHEVCRAYHSIFKRIGINVVQVDADTGKIGGTLSHEFQLLSEVGEDEVLTCPCGKYSANKELALGHVDPARPVPLTSEDLMTMLASSVSETKPSFKVEVALDASKRHGALIFLAKGREANGIKVQSVLGSGAEIVHLSHFFGNLHTLQSLKMGLDTSLGLPPASPSAPTSHQVRESLLSGIRERCTAIHLTLPANWEEMVQVPVTSLLHAIEKGEISTGHFRFAREGDHCAKCDGEAGTANHVLKSHRGIELGHAFYLGTKYSSVFDASLQAKDTKKVPMVMGCFGLGLGRIMAGVVEVSHDQDGIIWPANLAPYRICIIADKSPQIVEKAQALSKEIVINVPFLDGEIVLDDRDESVGFKLKDAQLIGYPRIVVLGKAYLSSGKAEFHLRDRGEMKMLTLPEVVDEFVK